MAKPIRPRHPGVGRRSSASKGLDEHPGTSGIASFTRIESPAIWVPKVENFEALTGRLRIGPIVDPTQASATPGSAIMLWWPVSETENLENWSADEGGQIAQFGYYGLANLAARDQFAISVFNKDTTSGRSQRANENSFIVYAGIYGAAFTEDYNGASAKVPYASLALHHTSDTPTSRSAAIDFFLKEDADGIPYVSMARSGRSVTGISDLPADWDTAWGEWGYAQAVADVSNIGATDTSFASLGSITYVGGRKYKFTAHAQVQAQNATTVCTLKIKESTTVLNSSSEELVSAGGTGEIGMDVMHRTDSLSEGAHTINATVVFNAGTTNKVSASSTKYSWIMVEDIGPA